MSYQHVENLYANQTILLFRECYALEKIHGTSASVRWQDGRAWLSSGGAPEGEFRAAFDLPALEAAFRAMGHPRVTVYGEAYGPVNRQAHVYGDRLRFVAFEARVGDLWLAVPSAESVAQKLGLDFVPYAKVPTDLAALDAERDAPSEQATRNGVSGPQPREGVVLRPLVEVTLNNGDRVVAKHKGDAHRETASPRRVVDPREQVVLTRADAIAEEWVTPTRLEHVLDKLPGATVRQMGAIVAAMVEDVVREARGEIVDGKEARVAIGRRTAALFRARGAT